jgi:RHH-type rel operon transcriptional repressor/antitoxin RelB
MDDVEDVYLAEKRLEELRAGHSQPVPLDDITKRYGLAD